MLTQPDTTSTQPDPGELADLDALAGELSKLGFRATRVTPRGESPQVDTGHPRSMIPGKRIHAQAGMYFWHTAGPIAPSDQPATATAIIARALTPTRQHS